MTGGRHGIVINCKPKKNRKKKIKILENAHKLSRKCCQVQLCSELELELRQLVSFMPLEGNVLST